MLLKWIVCTVPTHHQARFSHAQEQWRRLAGAPGFLGQTGGWNVRASGEACILAFWHDRNAYRGFMQTLHDDIFHGHQQQTTYSTIAVHVFEAVGDTAGSEPHLFQAIRQSRGLGTADCTVKPGRASHFIQAQETLWNPAMRQAGGLRYGVFGRSETEPVRFLTATFRESEAAHETYQLHHVPRLRAAPGTTNDLEHITSRFVRLEETWTVLPE